MAKYRREHQSRKRDSAGGSGRQSREGRSGGDKRTQGSSNRENRSERGGSAEGRRGSAEGRSVERSGEQQSAAPKSGALVVGRNALLAYLEELNQDEETSVPKAQINKIFISDSAGEDERLTAIKQLSRQLGIPFVICPKSKLDSMVSLGTNHQGVVGQMSP